MPDSTPGIKQRLDYLDGLRGLTALYVVFYHCRGEFTWQHPDGGFSHWLRALTAWLDFGHYAVVVFIVLSGYCLMRPVALSPTKTLAGGVKNYLKRRAWRTLPAYYGAVVFSLLLIDAVPGLQHPADAQWDRCLPAFRPDMLASHLLMIHNLRRDWYQTIDGPLWSMATEWDTYLAFALLMIPAWRMSGIRQAVILALMLGFMPHLLLPFLTNFDWACPWFLGCFALGMAAAAVSFSQDALETRWRTRLPWTMLAAVVVGGVLLLFGLRPLWCDAHWPIADTLAAVATACFLVAATRRIGQAGKASRGLDTLAARPLVRLGAFSYSLYLIHYPLLALVHIPIRQWGLRPDAAYLSLTALAVPLSLATAYAFARVFDIPFQRNPAQSRTVPSPEKVTKKAA